MKKLVTNNEYKRICEIEASNYWKKIKNANLKGEQLQEFKNAAYKEYDNYLDQFEILAFNINTNNVQLTEMINLYCTTETKKENIIRYDGHLYNSDMIYYFRDLFKMNFIYNDSYNSSLYNDDLNLFISYCEGDLSFTITDTIESYKKEKERIIDFYENHY